VRRLAALATGSVLACTAVIALLHVLPAGRALDPLSVPISNDALTRAGWLFDLAVLLLALGLAALLWALVAGGWTAPSSAAFTVLAACCLGMIVVTVVPDRTSGGALTTAGRVHWVAAMAAFGGIPLVPALLGRRCAVGSGCSRVPRVARWLSRSAAVWFTVLLTGSVLRFATSLDVWHVGGVVERGLAVTDVLVAIVLAGWAQRARHGACPLGPQPSSSSHAPALVHSGR
jgi:hypothetical protein